MKSDISSCKLHYLCRQICSCIMLPKRKEKQSNIRVPINKADIKVKFNLKKNCRGYNYCNGRQMSTPNESLCCRRLALSRLVILSNGEAGDLTKSTTKSTKFIRKNYLRFFNHISILKSKMISNDQELIQSYPTSCPQNQKGNN